MFRPYKWFDHYSFSAMVYIHIEGKTFDIIDISSQAKYYIVHQYERNNSYQHISNISKHNHLTNFGYRLQNHNHRDHNTQCIFNLINPIEKKFSTHCSIIDKSTRFPKLGRMHLVGHLKMGFCFNAISLK